MICIWCNIDKLENCFSGKAKHCKECHYNKYKKTKEERLTINVICPNCNISRFVRTDAKKKSKSDLCNKCSPLKNKQLYKSEHGLDINTDIYKRWLCVKGRVKQNEKAKWYKNRGIIVCEEWYDYKNFYNWCISSGFKKELELDRIDNNGNYCPENCRWITHKENCNNKGGY
jgi:hypothetical protein